MDDDKTDAVLDLLRFGSTTLPHWMFAIRGWCLYATWTIPRCSHKVFLVVLLYFCIKIWCSGTHTCSQMKDKTEWCCIELLKFVSTHICHTFAGYLLYVDGVYDHDYSQMFAWSFSSCFITPMHQDIMLWYTHMFTDEGQDWCCIELLRFGSTHLCHTLAGIFAICGGWLQPRLIFTYVCIKFSYRIICFITPMRRRDMMLWYTHVPSWIWRLSVLDKCQLLKLLCHTFGGYLLYVEGCLFTTKTHIHMFVWSFPAGLAVLLHLCVRQYMMPWYTHMCSQMMKAKCVEWKLWMKAKCWAVKLEHSEIWNLSHEVYLQDYCFITHMCSQLDVKGKCLGWSPSAELLWNLNILRSETFHTCCCCPCLGHSCLIYPVYISGTIYKAFLIHAALYLLAVIAWIWILISTFCY